MPTLSAGWQLSEEEIGRDPFAEGDSVATAAPGSPGGAGTETVAGAGTVAGKREPIRLTLITNGRVDVREILADVAQRAGYSLRIAPDVSAQVDVHLEDVPFGQALEVLLEPAQLAYQVADGCLSVYKRGLATRWFSFDYPVTERQGRGELLVSGRSKQSRGGQSGGGEDENESHVTSLATMSVWPEIISALQSLVFAGAEIQKSQEQQSQSHAISLSDQAGRSLVVNPMAGLVQVTAEPDRIEQVGGLLARLNESLLRQVAIEVRILEVTLQDSDRTGIDWSNFSGDHVDVDFNSTEGLTNPAFLFRVKNSRTTGLLEMISEQGQIKVLSSPRITTLNNQKAVVRVVTEEIFYEAMVAPPVVTNGVATDAIVEYYPRVVPVGIVLDVTPQIGQSGIVTLNVHPTISNIVRVETSPNQDTQPVISVRELDTVGKVQDGETLVIAGLMSEGLRESSAGIPLLKEIPLLGYLFKRSLKEKTKTELVMLLTPMILDEGHSEAWAADLERTIRGGM